MSIPFPMNSGLIIYPAGRGLSPQVFIGLIDPIGTGRREDIDINGVFERDGGVRHIWRDAEKFARSNRNLPAVDHEVKRAGLYVGDLLVKVTMQGNDAIFLEQNAGDHHLISDYD